MGEIGLTHGPLGLRYLVNDHGPAAGPGFFPAAEDACAAVDEYVEHVVTQGVDRFPALFARGEPSLLLESGHADPDRGRFHAERHHQLGQLAKLDLAAVVAKVIAEEI